MSEERMLTPREIAERCQVSTKTVLRAIRCGRLRASRLGDSGAYRVWERDMHARIEASVVEPPRPETEPAPVLLAIEPPAPARGRLVMTPEMGRRARA
jgi:excisionase family DNA binding protein